jgi:energy-converting hydrogenase Eha subunit B
VSGSGDTQSTQYTYRVVTAAVVAPLLAKLRRRRDTTFSLCAIGGVVLGALGVLAYSDGISLKNYPIFSIVLFGVAIFEGYHARRLGTFRQMLNDGALLAINGETLTATLVENRCTIELEPDAIAALLAATEEAPQPATVLEIPSTLIAPLLKQVKRRRLRMLSVGTLGCLTIGAVAVLAGVHTFNAWSVVLGILFVVVAGVSIVLANAVRKAGKIGRMLKNGAQATLCGYDVTATLLATKCTIEIDIDHLVALLTDNSDRLIHGVKRRSAKNRSR